MSGTGCSTSHTYAATGSFTASVTATDAVGGQASNSVTVMVNPTPSAGTPTASPNPAAPGQTVTFTTAPSGGTGTLTCAWTFGDGSTGTGCTATHAYSVPGSFVASVTATDSLGTTSAASQVTVSVQDFTITNNGPITIQTSQCGTAIVTVTGQGGFTGSVNLAVTFVSPGINATLMSPIVTGGSGSVPVKICDQTAPASPPNYSVNVTGTSGTLSHTTTIVVTVATGNNCPHNTSGACQAPSFIQLNWKHRLSFSRSGGVQTWKFGVFNPNNDTIFVTVKISGSDGAGVSGFTVTSAVIVLNPGQALTSQTVSFAFPPEDIGDTFTFTGVIQWGTSSASQPNSSSSSLGGVPTSGSFTIV